MASPSTHHLPLASVGYSRGRWRIGAAGASSRTSSCRHMADQHRAPPKTRTDITRRLDIPVAGTAGSVTPCGPTIKKNLKPRRVQPIRPRTPHAPRDAMDILTYVRHDNLSRSTHKGASTLDATCVTCYCNSVQCSFALLHSYVGCNISLQHVQV